MRRSLLLLCASALVPGVLCGQGQEVAAVALVEVREALSERRFEEALSRIDALLRGEDLGEGERIEAWVLRSEAHVALGDLDEVERDYRAILGLRPHYTPAERETPRKARERFVRARDELVGRLHARLDPPDARLSVDGREVSSGGEEGVAVLAGERLLRAEAPGFDPLEQLVTVPAAGKTEVALRLVPNARTILVSTEPDGVELRIDGASVGLTERTGQGPATIRVEDLPLGEHLLELSKPCHRTVRRQEILAVDLGERSAHEYPLVTLPRVEARLDLRGAPAGAELRVDGQPVIAAEPGPVIVCPGTRRIELYRAGRLLWFAEVPFGEDEERALQVEPRPNIVLVGASSWPASLEPLAREFNQLPAREAPPSLDLSLPESWAALDLPPQLDLGVAIGAGSAAHVYSPLLRRVWVLEPLTEGRARPTWTRASWGMFLADSERGGPALVVHLEPGGAAERVGLRPGDRVRMLGGSEIESAAQSRRILEIASARSDLEVVWTTPKGERREGRLAGITGPHLWAPESDSSETAIRAAWALVDSVSEPSLASSALANLALIFSGAGDHERALATLARVRFPDRNGVGEGTIRYLAGRELEALGRREEAIAAHRAAASGSASHFDDEGPRVAPAARSRLAHLGAPSETVSSP